MTNAKAIRIRSKSGNPDSYHWQPVCEVCGWEGAYYSNRTIDGRNTAVDVARGHRCSAVGRCEFCGRIGCEWTRHPEALRDVRLDQAGKLPGFELWRDDPRHVEEESWER